MHPLFQETAAKLASAVTALGDTERLLAATDQVTEESLATAADVSTESGWEILRNAWNANGRRLDDVRGSIANKRKRDRLVAMPRTDYRRIINALAHEGEISETAKKYALELHALFMAHRRTKNPKPEVVGSVKVLDAQLEDEFNRIAAEPRPPHGKSTARPVEIQPQTVA
jgi:hypothetical protein